MSIWVNIGKLEQVSGINSVSQKLRTHFCAAVSVNDTLADEVIQELNAMSTEDILKLSQVKIEGGTDSPLWIKSYDHSRRPLNDPSVFEDFGLSSALVELVVKDHTEYLEATNQGFAISQFVVGNTIRAAWHSDTNRTARIPQAHRDLSCGPNMGMYIASANQDLSMKAQRISPFATFFSEFEIKQYEKAGVLTSRQQAQGERLIFRDGFLHRSYTLPYDDQPPRPQLRLLTGPN